MTWTPPLTVAQELDAARTAHTSYRSNSGSVHKDGKVKTSPDYTAARLFVVQAIEHRRAAHGLDPEHTDPSWALDAVPHEKLMAFYDHYLSAP